ncbi:hypothetical protein A9Q99_27365 [Gammaproteobacteria bacterium 45_16_T64]|nr:hypothetical protein A9Q99_27365 [Gammaproteobacteria bacterium 45_16_T64]
MYRVHSPSNKTQPITLLFIPGAFHGDWSFTHFVEFFTSNGFECVTFNFPTPNKWTPINVYTNHLTQCIASLNRRIVCIAHSMGSYVLAKYTEKHFIEGAILLAPMPLTGWFFSFIKAGWKFPITTLESLISFDINRFILNDSALKNYFFSDKYNEHQLVRYRQKLTKESSFALCIETTTRPVNTSKSKNNIGFISVLASNNDGLFPLNSARDTAKIYRANLLVLDDFSHDLMLDPKWTLPANIVFEEIMKNTT